MGRRSTYWRENRAGLKRKKAAGGDVEPNRRRHRRGAPASDQRNHAPRRGCRRPVGHAEARKQCNSMSPCGNKAKVSEFRRRTPMCSARATMTAARHWARPKSQAPMARADASADASVMASSEPRRPPRTPVPAIQAERRNATSLPPLAAGQNRIEHYAAGALGCRSGRAKHCSATATLPISQATSAASRTMASQPPAAEPVAMNQASSARRRPTPARRTGLYGAGVSSSSNRSARPRHQRRGVLDSARSHWNSAATSCLSCRLAAISRSARAWRPRPTNRPVKPAPSRSFPAKFKSRNRPLRPRPTRPRSRRK